MTKTFAIKNFGCQMNVYDGERMAELLRAEGMAPAEAGADAALEQLDPDLAFPVAELGTPRGRQGAPKAKVALPEHWLDDTSGAALELDDDEHVSGG